MKNVKFFAMALFCGALALVGCNPGDDNKGGVNPPVIIPGGETPTMPEIDAPDAEHVIVAVQITTDVCDKVWIEGPFNGWTIAVTGDESGAWEMAAIEGATGWYQVTLPMSGLLDEAGESKGACKVLLSGADGTIPSDWSSQWGAGQVTLVEGLAEIGTENGSEPTLILGSDAAGSVVYVKVEGWKTSPCVEKEHYASVTFNLTIPEAVETGVFLHGPFVDASWNGIEMTKVDDLHYTITVDNLDQYTQYQYTLAADNWDEKGLFVKDGACDADNQSINGATIYDEVTGFAAGCPTEE